LRTRWIAVAAVVAYTASATAQVYIPIPVTGYTQDVIADAVGTASSTTTATVDLGGGAIDSNVFFEQGYPGGATSGGTGLPPSGAIITSTNRSYQLGPISGDNSLRLTNAARFGTLTLAVPAREAALSLLLAASSGSPGAGTVTVNWSDGQSSNFIFQVYDWWENGTPHPPERVAIGGLGRVNRQTGTPSDLDLSLHPPAGICDFRLRHRPDSGRQLPGRRLDRQPGVFYCLRRPH
jgi:hypothetical protein